MKDDKKDNSLMPALIFSWSMTGIGLLTLIGMLVYSVWEGK